MQTSVQTRRFASTTLRRLLLAAGLGFVYASLSGPEISYKILVQAAILLLLASFLLLLLDWLSA